MPTQLSQAAPAPTRRSHGSIDPFEISCAVLGVAAIGLASFVDLACGDRVGTFLILLITGGFIGLLLGSLRKRRDRQ